MNKKQLIIMTILTLLITFMDISGIPSVLLFHITIADVNPGFLSLMINFVFISILTFIVFKFWGSGWKLGLTTNGLIRGLKRYSFAGILATIGSCLIIFAGLRPLNYKPSIWKILLEGILYYAGVGFIEELYVRGLFLNIVEKITSKRKNSTEIAILVSSVVFGVGHIPGVLGMGALVGIYKVMSTIGLGLYFGTIYKKTDNLWVPIILHILIDISALPYCFTTFTGYKTGSLIGLIVICLLLGSYSVMILKKSENKDRIDLHEMNLKRIKNGKSKT